MTLQATLPMPDLAILIDIPVHASFERRPERQNQYESNRERMEAVERGYRELWWAAPHLPTRSGQPMDWVIVNGMQSLDAVAVEILNHAQRHMPKPLRGNPTLEEIFNAE